MFKRFIRWILPLVVLVLIAMYFVLSPMLASYAAGTASPSIKAAPDNGATQFLIPDAFWRH